MNKKLFFFLAFVWPLGTNILFSQGAAQCGTEISQAQKDLENQITIADNNPNQSLPQINKTFYITVFVVREELPPNFDESVLPGAINKLNEAFSPISLKFKLCSPVKYIDNYQFNTLKAGENAKDLIIQNFEPGTINLYLVDSLIDQNNLSVKGLTYMPSENGKHCIFVNKKYISGTSSTLAHQLGHFFNLYHTHERDAFGAEYVDGSNCSTAGDRCCDTNADPNVEPYMTEDIYNGKVKDSKGEIYNPSPKNIMSFGPEGIRCFFSRQQFLRIIHALDNYRNYLH